MLHYTRLLLLIPAFLGFTEEFSFSRNTADAMLQTPSDKILRVREVSFPVPEPDAAQIDSMFDAAGIPFQPIDTHNWPGYEYNPQVQFRIAYSATEIYLQYRVKETCIKAVFAQDTGALPYKDSCVEFFIIPGTDNTYYNLEMNCIGKGTFAGGDKRSDRTRFGQDVLSRIRRRSTLGDAALGIRKIEDEPAGSAWAEAGCYDWQLTAALPVALFSLSPVPALKGRTVRANFYKCGDDMPQPHYLSWNPIDTPKPNFHTPDYFGYLVFE